MSARERRGMNCDTEHYGLLHALTGTEQSHGYFCRLYCIAISFFWQRGDTSQEPSEDSAWELKNTKKGMQMNSFSAFIHRQEQQILGI